MRLRHIGKAAALKALQPHLRRELPLLRTDGLEVDRGRRKARMAEPLLHQVKRDA